jgi:putative GTP pyrophosphokinase
MGTEHLLAEYERHHAALKPLAQTLERELHAHLTQATIAVQFVASRVKTVDSLRKKIARPEKTYTRLWDVTDLIGLRISTWFEDAIEDVARLIERAYAVDFTHSTDKLRFTDAGRFGYRSLHYVCGLPGGLLPELRFEIQVRTALQHAWAEVEHDLGYKADAVPEQIRRRFSRVASLLEIADQEFVSIRTELEQYQRSVSEALQREHSVPLDALSVAALAKSPAVEALDHQVAEALGVARVGSVYYPEYLSTLLRLAGLQTTDDVRRALATHQVQVARLVVPYLRFAQRQWGLTLSGVEPGYSLFFLAHAVMLDTPERTLSKVARFTGVYRQLDELDERAAHEVASGLVAALTTLQL